MTQLKRVTWAPEVYLSQVRLFLSEEAPSQSRIGAQDQLIAKGSWMGQKPGIGSDKSLPPGFDVPKDSHKFHISQAPVIKWQCPSRLLLNPEWRVVAGEESKEVHLENQRQFRVLETIYSYLFAIPPNPSVASAVENSIHDDLLTPVIPITAIEDEDASEQLDSEWTVCASNLLQETDLAVRSVIRPSLEVPGTSGQNQLQNNVLGHRSEKPATTGGFSAEPDIAAAASIACAAIMGSKVGPVDPDLLIKLLSNPALVEKLMSESGKPKQTFSTIVTSSSLLPQGLPPPSHVTHGGGPLLPQTDLHRNSAANSARVSTSSMQPLDVYENFPAVNAPRLPAMSIRTLDANEKTPTANVVRVAATSMQPSEFFYEKVPVVNASRLPAVSMWPSEAYDTSAAKPPAITPQVKDMNYCKRLVQLHGQVSPDPDPVQFSYVHGQSSNFMGMKRTDGGVQITTQREQKHKVPKPCAYFNTPRGCCNGASCPFVHDRSLAEQVEPRNTIKRIKLDARIAGRI